MGQKKCQNCDGSGHDHARGETCRECEGRGRVSSGKNREDW